MEKGRHPRFAIGESSTPVANLVLEGLARTYDLPRLLPLTDTEIATLAHKSLAKQGLTFHLDTKVTAAKQWEKRKAEIRETLAYYSVGHMPPPPGNVKGREVRSEIVACRQTRRG